MRTIQPITEAHATPEALALYQEIKALLQSSSVPVLFQYLATNHAFFVSTWERIQQQHASRFFTEATTQLLDFAQDAIAEIYTPSDSVQIYLTQLPPEEYRYLSTTIQGLLMVNLQLLLISIGMREGIKGALRGTPLLQGLSRNHSPASREEQKSATEQLLVPVGGAVALPFQQFQSFFRLIATDSQALSTRETYLKLRVGLESITQLLLSTLSPALIPPYKELMQFAKGDPTFYELLYLLKDVFPSQLPHAVLTTLLMQQAGKHSR